MKSIYAPSKIKLHFELAEVFYVYFSNFAIAGRENKFVFPVALVTGPRQVGKTTMLKNCMEKNRTFVSLDEFEIRNLAKSDPALFFQKYTPPLLIDEIQYAPELFPYIKSIVDESGENGMFCLTKNSLPINNNVFSMNVQDL